MDKHKEQLTALYQGEILSELNGPGGLLAVTERELYYITDSVSKDTRLSWIKRITRNPDSKNIDVLADQSLLMEIAPNLFPQEELKAFLESLRTHILRARSTPTLFQDNNPVPYQAKTRSEDEEPISTISTLTPEMQAINSAASNPLSTTLNSEISGGNTPISKPNNPTLGDKSMWSYDGTPANAATTSLPITQEVPVLKTKSRLMQTLAPIMKIVGILTIILGIVNIVTGLKGGNIVGLLTTFSQSLALGISMMYLSES